MKNRTPNEAWINGYPCSRIRERMEELKMSSTDLERILIEDGVKISASAIRFWLSGYSRPDLDKIPSLARALRCSVNYLFGEDDAPDVTISKICEITGLSEKSIMILKNSCDADGLFEVPLSTLSFIIEQEFPYLGYPPDDAINDVLMEYEGMDDPEEELRIKEKVAKEWFEAREVYKGEDFSQNARIITSLDYFLRPVIPYEHDKKNIEAGLLGEVTFEIKKLKRNYDGAKSAR